MNNRDKPGQQGHADARAKRRLAQLPVGGARLELPTIMDRVLAAEHGSPYVQLAAFAIDVDRVYVEAPDQGLPFGWEVFVTECYALAALDASDPTQLSVLEDACLSILEQPPDHQGYGSQLLFAVHDAVARGLLPPTLGALFQQWRGQPRQLRKALDALWSSAAARLAACAAHCLQHAPPLKLAPPTLDALQKMQAGRWPLPSAT